MDLSVVEKRLYGFFGLIGLVVSMAFIFAVLNTRFESNWDPNNFYFSGDFPLFWAAIKVVNSDDRENLYDEGIYSQALTDVTGKDDKLIWPYPPSSMLFLAPLGNFESHTAFFIWQAAGLILLGLVAYKTLPDGRFAAFLILTSPATVYNTFFAQSGSIACALLLAGLLLLERRPLIAGIFIGLLTMKPQLGILIPFALLAGGYWRTFLSASVTVLVLFLASSAFLGWEIWIDYLEAVPSSTLDRHLIGPEAGQMPTHLPSIPTITAAGRVLGIDSGVTWSLLVFAIALGSLAVIWAFRRPGPFHLKVALTIAAGALAAPYFHNYDLIAMTAALYLILQNLPDKRVVTRLVALIAYFSPFLILLFTVADLPVGPLILLAVFAAAYLRLREPHAFRPRPTRP